jgi:hypothetical protein
MGGAVPLATLDNLNGAEPMDTPNAIEPEPAPLIDWEWLNYGALIIRFPDGREVFMQGDEAASTFDELDHATPEVAQLIASEYEVVARHPEPRDDATD